MAMPEATVYEDDCAIAREDDIRLAWNRSRMETIAKAEREQRLPEVHFRLCVLAPDARHERASVHFGDDVGTGMASHSLE